MSRPSVQPKCVCVCVCVCVRLNILAKLVPLSGGILRVSELQQASGHSESILFDQCSLDLHVKQLFVLKAAGKREKRSERHREFYTNTPKFFLKSVEKLHN